MALETIALMATMPDAHTDAAVLAGGMKLIDSLWEVLHPAVEEPQEAVPEFVDPAAI